MLDRVVKNHHITQSPRFLLCLRSGQSSIGTKKLRFFPAKNPIDACWEVVYWQSSGFRGCAAQIFAIYEWHKPLFVQIVLHPKIALCKDGTKLYFYAIYALFILFVGSHIDPQNLKKPVL